MRAGSTTRCCSRRSRRRSAAFADAIGQRRSAGQGADVAARAADRLRARHSLRGRADDGRHLDAHRHRSARAPDVDVQSVAGDRAAAARADLVRPGQRQHRVRASSIRCCGRSRSTRTRASCRCRTRCAWSAATTGSRGLSLRRRHPDSGRVPEHPHRTQDRLGVRVAHADRRGARVRRVVRLRRPRLVHLREQEPARDSGRVRRPVHRDPDRARRRERHLPHDRDRAPFAAGGCKADERTGEQALADAPTIRAFTWRFRSPTSTAARALLRRLPGLRRRTQRRTTGSISTSSATRSSRTRSAPAA